MAENGTPLAIVVMGVSGSGKTTVGTALAQRTGAVFADADDFHSAANKAKMAADIPLTDEDRAPWLATLNGVLRGWVAQGQHGVLACSALKASYRDTLASGIGPQAIAFVWLDLSQEVIAARMATRHHEFMNPGLLASQFATLEAPADAIKVVNDRPVDVVVGEIVAKLAGLGGS